ncbi:hypothetical protein ACHAXN_000742, partial [Cyclotella atomus]
NNYLVLEFHLLVLCPNEDNAHGGSVTTYGPLLNKRLCPLPQWNQCNLVMPLTVSCVKFFLPTSTTVTFTSTKLISVMVFIG